ncbi:DUF3598 family protein [Merismopedia glauca]|uniref:Uncharacterized protein n=1 Tax=Merismopedia glauca CCAP 1448/3 TaxID=1296344 RepID=A0A2T1C7Q2_9CYAN|nr:DUF3598 family protein [Merismopedia glauca]PSB04188.1 hypothetical protein C7B64_04885 [Merismopedia glauca CCAP 1448/3]
MKSQRECFLQNLGSWKGSFTQFSITGEQIDDVESLLRLETIDNSDNIKLTLQRFYPTGVDEKVIEYDPSALYNILFFETGAFSQGSLQWAPFSQFGAELALVHGDRRLRIVQSFNSDSILGKITLIRERNPDSQIPERPRLQVEELIGQWEGEAVILSPQNHTSTKCRSILNLRLESPNQLVQELSFGEKGSGWSLTSKGEIDGNTLKFSQMEVPVQVTLLPDGASALFPLAIASGQSFFLEAGWLVEPNLRYRLIRRYDEKGAWNSLILVTERKVS